MRKPRNRALVTGAGLIVLASALYGCENFLESPPQGSLDELSLATKSGVEASLVASYRMLGGWVPGIGLWGAAASNWPFGSVPSDDAYKGSDALDQAPINDLELYNWGLGGGQTYLNDKWKAVYEGVVRSNATVSLLDRVIADKPGEIGDADANGIRGEALFLRAHYHFEAWKMWGNIPYYTEADTDFRKANSSSAEVVQNILADLNQAISLLSETPRNGQVGRVTSWTAKAYKGRVEVYSGDYTNGRTTLRDVVDNGPYALEADFSRVWTGFSEFANGPETILAYQASVNDGNPNGDNGNWSETLNYPHGGSPFGCCGFHQPSQNLVNFFRVDASGLPIALTDATWNDNDAEFDASATDPVDPRLDWTVGRDGVPYKDWSSSPGGNGIHNDSWIRDIGRSGPYNGKKNVHEFNSGARSNVGWNATTLNSMNIHLYRYADLLLLLAEAEVAAGDLPAAMELVNQVRARAAVAAQGPGTSADNMAVPIDDPSITWADYEIGLYTTFPNATYAAAAVAYERRLELAMEGHRLFDLRRWGIAADVLNAFIAVEGTRRPYLASAATFGAAHALYPIPDLQIELSKVDGADRLTQNSGW